MIVFSSKKKENIPRDLVDIRLFPNIRESKLIERMGLFLP
jgi:hypothetical protein